jgi:very-short-patch-repair endonuclease
MLREMGWSHSFEHETAEGFSLDLAQPESKLAIEVDGPSHYLRDVSSGENVVNGATRLKTRQLRSFGWTVAHISFLDWDHKSESERRQLVAAKLGELGLPVHFRPR